MYSSDENTKIHVVVDAKVESDFAVEYKNYLVTPPESNLDRWMKLCHCNTEKESRL
jgi:hypothetical protein